MRKPLLPAWRYWPAVALASMIILATYAEALNPNQQPSEQHAQQEANETGPLGDLWHWLAKDSISFFTFALFVVAGGQGILILKQIRLGQHEFVAAHRPRLRIRVMQTDGLGGATFVTIANVGESTARITGIAGVFGLKRNGRWISGRPDLSKENTPPDATAVLRSGTRRTVMLSMNQPDPSEIIEISNGTNVLYAIGVIRYIYDDLPRKDRLIVRCTGFCWAYNPDIEEFFDPEKSGEYNYED